MIPLTYYVTLSAIVFFTGLVGVLIRRNIIIILLSVELMLNATNINFVAFSQSLHNIAGQVFVFLRSPSPPRKWRSDLPSSSLCIGQRTPSMSMNFNC